MATLENSNVVLINTHSPKQCAGEYCTIHNRSLHHMRGWPQHWRSDRGIMERVNPFGGACPDPDSPWPRRSSQWVHGCIINPIGGSIGMCVPWNYAGEPATFMNKHIIITKSGLLFYMDDVFTFSDDNTPTYIGQADQDTLCRYWPEK